MKNEWHGQALMKAIREQAARQLLAAGKILQNEDRKRRGTVNPKPHRTPAKRGEYPRLRTGMGRAGVMMEPVSLSEVMQTLTVRVGYAKHTFYSAVLENEGWLGLQNTFADIRGQLIGAVGSVR